MSRTHNSLQVIPVHRQILRPVVLTEAKVQATNASEILFCLPRLIELRINLLWMLSSHPQSCAFAVNSPSRSNEAEEYLIGREMQIWRQRPGFIYSGNILYTQGIFFG